LTLARRLASVVREADDGTVVGINTWTFSYRCDGPNFAYRVDAPTAQAFLNTYL
jgi:hypothetical protein